MTPIGDLGIALKADVDDYHKAVRSSRDATGLLTGSIRGLSAAMRNMGVVVTAASAVAGAGMFALSRRAERVNSAFREVDTITNSLASSQEKYGEIVSDLNTEFGLQENQVGVIRGLYQSLSAGIEDTEDSQREFLTTAGQLATVGLVDLETSVDVLSTVLNTYNMETDEAERVSESLFRTVQLGKVTLDELAPVMGRIAALGSNMGVEIEELGAAMAQLTRNGFESRIAATGLRAVLRGFMRPSESMREALRGIALEQDGLVDSLTEGNDEVENLSDNYRQAQDALEGYTQAQEEARSVQEENSLAIQRARLAISAIEEGRVDQIDDEIAAEMARKNSIEELEEQIADYRFEVNEARISEEEARISKQETEDEIQSLKDSFIEEVDAAGDLENGIGELFLQNEGLVDTLVELDTKLEDTSMGMDDLFPRSRGLQAALALLGEDSENFVEILEGFEDGTLDAEEAWADLSKEVREEQFDGDIENFKELQDLDMEEEFNNIRGPQEDLRDSASELGEAASELGNIFTEDLIGTISDFASSVSDAVGFFERMEEEARSGISRFLVLAVSLGLVLGPLLLFGGQIALIASAMGTTLIPFLAIAAGLFGIFATSLKTAVSGGEESEGMFSTMQDTLSGLIGFLGHLSTLFDILILPELISFGNTLKSLFSSLSEVFFDTATEGGSILELIAPIFKQFAAGISILDNFISKNEELIANVFEEIIDILVNRVIPAFIDFGTGVIAVLSEIDWSLLAPLVGILSGFGIVLVEIIGFIGRWLQKNSELVASLIQWTAIIAGLLFGLGKLATILAPLTKFLTIIGRVLMNTRSATIALRAAINILRAKALAPLLKIFAPFIKGLGVIIKLGKLLAVGFGIIASAIGISTAALLGIVVVVGIVITAIWYFRDEIFAALEFIVKGFLNLPLRIESAISTIIDKAGDWGRTIVTSIAQGMLDRIDAVADAASGIAETISSFLPSSPAEKGALSGDGAPTKRGESIPKGVAEGVENSEGDLDDAFGDLGEDELAALEEDLGEDFGDDFELDIGETDIEGDLNHDELGVGEDSDLASEDESMGMGGGTEIIIDEHAVFFEKGAFQGVADEELPEKVRDVVDGSMEEVVDELRGAGRDSIERL